MIDEDGLEVDDISERPMKFPWDIRRKPREWSHEEFDERIDLPPRNMEYVGGIFDSHRARMTVLSMILENIGLDMVGRLEDWERAIAERRRKELKGALP